MVSPADLWGGDRLPRGYETRLRDGSPACLLLSRLISVGTLPPSLWSSYGGRGRFAHPTILVRAPAFSRHDLPESCKNTAPKNRRAQGRPDARTHPQPCVQVKKARKQVTTG